MGARVLAAASTVAAALLVCAAPAGASYTLGAPDLTASPAGVPGDDTLFQEADPSATLTASGPGVVVAFRARFATDGAPHPFNFRVMRPELGHRFTMISSTPGTVPAGPGFATVDQPARAPIKTGELIGIDAPAGATVVFTGAPTGTIMSRISPIAGDGTISQPAAPTLVNPGRLLLNATVEPDADEDGFGDETQDKCVGTAGPYNGCPSTVAIDAIKQKGIKKVKVAVTVPGAGILDVGSASDRALANKAARSVKAVSANLTAITRQQLTLTLRLTKSARARLGDTGKLRLKLKAVYTPLGGTASSAIKRKKLKQ